MTKVVQETDWNQGNANTLEDAIFDTPKDKEKHLGSDVTKHRS